MKKGDDAIIYHTGDEKSAIGVAKIVSDPYPDPSGEDDRVAVVDLKIVKRLPNPVSLSVIKADRAFAGWDLIRNGRLGVVPVPDPMWDRLMELTTDDSG